MSGLVAKVLLFPAVILIADGITIDIYYPSILEAIATGVVLALASHAAERLVLRPGTLWFTTGLDIAVAAAVMYASAYAFPSARVTLAGGLLVASAIGIGEYLYHRYLTIRPTEEGNR